MKSLIQTTTIISRIILLLLLLLLLQFYYSSQADLCPTSSCSLAEENTIQFPFQLPGNRTKRCGYPGFDLTCGPKGQTFLNLASTLYLVNEIYYPNQLIYLSDPNSCIPNQVLKLNLTATPFVNGPDTLSYTFLNCSRTNLPNLLPSATSIVMCMSNKNYTVLMTLDKTTQKKLENEMKCKVIKNVNVALWWPEIMEGYLPLDMSDVFLQLRWNLPNCADCILSNGICSFANHSTLHVDCFFPPNSTGLPKNAKYVLVLLAVIIPSILCIIGLTYYIRNKFRARNQIRHYRNSSETSLAIFHQPIILTLGLDNTTIESFPKTILGESKRLPKPSDGTCPICLSEYETNETLRSIPECNHFFHADCIDEWLRMNATCPLCRKSPHQFYGASTSR